MVQITEDNIPLCKKCEKNPAICYMNQMWICGECIHKFKQKQIEMQQKAFLEG